MAFPGSLKVKLERAWQGSQMWKWSHGLHWGKLSLLWKGEALIQKVKLTAKGGQRHNAEMVLVPPLAKIQLIPALVSHSIPSHPGAAS